MVTAACCRIKELRTVSAPARPVLVLVPFSEDKLSPIRCIPCAVPGPTDHTCEGHRNEIQY